jgi:uncharacterized membrane protein YeaQ/YmgE (transglycosylase-associated protein family)
MQDLFEVVLRLILEGIAQWIQDAFRNGRLREGFCIVFTILTLIGLLVLAVAITEFALSPIKTTIGAIIVGLLGLSSAYCFVTRQVSA